MSTVSLQAANESCSSVAECDSFESFDERQFLRELTAICERAAQGDLEARIAGCEQAGKFGPLCRSINHMLDMADSYVREASAAMSECSHDRFHRPILLRGLKGAYRQSASTLNQAGVKMEASNRQLQTTANLAVETVSNVTMVASACAELNSSNEEIARQAADSVAQTSDAVDQARRAAEAIKEMSVATQKIESIVTLINRIAGQTNLLALNATIEAARAGEHGRGFAVVANEVKELARSSSKATDEIGQQIEAMRNTVRQVVELMEGVKTTIDGVNQGAGTIAHAVKEQAEAANDISRNITQVSQHTTEISSGIKKVFNREK